MTDATVKAMIQAVNRQSYKAYIARRLWKTAAAYELHVWAYMRDFFTGGDAFGFIDNMANEIENQFGRAWREGAAEMGVEPGDFTDEDNDYLSGLIETEQNYLDGIAGDIEAYIAEGGHTDAEFNARFRNRAALWSHGYERIVNEAKVHFGGKEKLKWVEGPTEKGCDVCRRLDGIVAYASEWDEAGVRPQQESLPCHGINCLCNLEPTDEKRTRSALDKILLVLESVNV